MQRERACVVDLEVCRTGDTVELVKVVGQHVGLKQGFAECGEGVGGVIHPAQQHGLIEQGGAGVAQRAERGGDLGVDLVGVIGVDDDDLLERAVAQHGQQFFGDPLGQHDRQAGVNAQTSDVRNRAQLAFQLDQTGIAETQRVAAAEDHLLDAVVGGDGREGFGEGAARMVAIREVPPEAVAAVDRAGAGGDQQRTAPVFVQQAGGAAGVFVADRVGAETRYEVEFGAQRQYLTEQRVVRIAMAHARDIATGHAQREIAMRGERGGEVRRVEAEGVIKILGPVDRVGEGALPERYLSRRRACGYDPPLCLHHSIMGAREQRVIAAMASFSTNEFRSGLKIMLDGNPCSIIENEFVKPGKGQAFNRVKIRNLLSGRVLEKTFKSGDTVEGADVVDTSMQYLYTDGEFWYFMHPETFEQVTAGAAAVGDITKWLKEQDMCEVTLWNGDPIAVTPPNFVEMRVVETDPGVRGDTSGGGGKPATLETGAVVRVPLFLEEGTVIRVDTRTGEYVSRVKE